MSLETQLNVDGDSADGTGGLPRVTTPESNRAQTLNMIWHWLEDKLESFGDYLNPILVKETRQALKSRQFLITFALVLVACWVVTIGGAAILGPSIYYAAAGGEMLLAYFVVLAFPLTVVVPFSAFRSLATEREDNTYELLSITTLSPHQIVIGKLGSAMVQMGVFFSAVTPCLAFTYLLRGIDIVTIALLLIYALLGSLGLSLIGLLMGAVAQQRFGQILLSVGLVIGLLWAFWLAVIVAMELIQSGYRVLDDRDFWVGNLAVLTAYLTTFGLMFCAAAALINFPSDNRSTPLRIAMLLQVSAFVGWMAYFWATDNYDLSFVAIMGTVAGCYWFFMGSMLTGEQDTMSHRVMRSLPQSLAGRWCLTWLNPGPGTGYFFVVANLATLVVFGILAIGVRRIAVGRVGAAPTESQILVFLIVGWSYAVAYLGIGKLIVAALRSVAEVRLLSSFLVHFLIVLAGTGFPYAVHMTRANLRQEDYTFLQLTNPVWTVMYLGDGGRLPAETSVILVVVPAVAICVLLINLRQVIDEIRRVRVAVPTRVVADELDLHPPPQPEPTNPWDTAQ